MVWRSDDVQGEQGNASKGDTIIVQANGTKLTDRQRKIYEIIKNAPINDTINDTINAQMLSEKFGTSVITIKRDLYVLRDMNLIQYVGSNKTGHWEAIRK